MESFKHIPGLNLCLDPNVKCKVQRLSTVFTIRRYMAKEFIN